MNADSYIYGTSFYHRFDVRPKLLFTLLYIIAVFFAESWYGIAGIVLLPLLISLSSVGAAETLRAIRRILPILILLFVFLPLQRRDGTPALVFSGTVIATEEGIYAVIRTAARFTALSMILMLLLMTSRNESIIAGLRFYHLSYNASIILSVMLRFIPYLGSVFSCIRDSMSLRLTEGKRGFPIFPSVTAFIVSAVRMIPDTASALEERGFGRKGRTEYRRLENGRWLLTEFALSAILPLIMLIIFR